MEISGRFRDILKSIDYHVNHLSRDFFANEERVPELLPIFTWFFNNITPKSNCVTPKELALYASISSKHDQYSSIKKVSEAMDKFYDKSTKDSKICSSDLEILEQKIFKSQRELNDLKAHRSLYEKKTQLTDDDISLLKLKENSISITCYETENNLNTAVKKFIDEVNTFGYNVNKLHDHVTNSMTNDNECLTKLASKNLIHLTNVWRQQICKMINIWFNKTNISSVINEELPTKIHTLGLLFESVTALRIAEMNEKCEIAKLNFAIRNIFSIKNCYEDQKNLQPNGPNITNYLAKHQEISIDLNQQLTSTEYDDLQSCISDTVIADAQRKFSEMVTINDHITFVQESMEHYIMISDVLWCLMRTGCSIANLKCELLLHCIKVLEKIFDDINYAQQCTLNDSETDALQSSNLKNDKTFVLNDVVQFDGYKRYSSLYTNSDEIEKLSKMVQKWKSKYHYSRDECNQLAILQQKLQVHNKTVNELIRKYSNAK